MLTITVEQSEHMDRVFDIVCEQAYTLMNGIHELSTGEISIGEIEERAKRADFIIELMTLEFCGTLRSAKHRN